MKFNEKLMELRKKEGLSQEELGYKLNVTRQTVSKWELGQTTPEMDKLVEMSKIFNISVDELINESEVITNENPVIEEKTIEDQAINKKGSRSNKVFVVIVIALIVVGVSIVMKTFTIFGVFNKVTGGSDDVTGKAESFFGRIFNLFDKAIEAQEKMLENNGEDVEKRAEDLNDKFSKTVFNSRLEVYKGTEKGSALKKLLDEIITNNKTDDKKIAVKYLETETQDSEEIKDLKTSFDNSKNFEISFDYDEKGYINKATIERVITESEVSSFNNYYEMYAGTNMGAGVISVLDHIITSNKTEERKLTVKYGEKEIQDEVEIKNIKRNIDKFDDYEITFEYDTDGFINKAIIEKI